MSVGRIDVKVRRFQYHANHSSILRIHDSYMYDLSQLAYPAAPGTDPGVQFSRTGLLSHTHFRR